ncbi:putative gustatory receptor 28b [Microplitis mediator]|uniref:putative gustatory receptor 28b n=1 Tax=Microplitis mediator TaxID=375433 RepID=UPI0025534839|nr:putative gustatory receptor 28b [Microplitis mediator]
MEPIYFINRETKKINNQENSVYYRCFMFIQHILFKITGISPWTMDTSVIFRNNKDFENNNFHCSFSYSGSCYNIILSAFIVFLTFYDISYNSSSQINSDKMLESITAKVEYSSLLFASLIPIIYIIRQKLLINVNNMFKIIDNKLNSCADYETENNYTNYFVFILNVIVTSGIITLRIMTFESLTVLFVRNSAYFISSWVTIQYVLLLNMIYKRFKGINSTLSKLGTNRSVISRSHESVIDDINKIKFAYLKLSDMCEDTETFYGLSILISIFILAVKSIFMLYQIILISLHVHAIDDNTYLFIIFLLRNVSLYMILTTNVTKIMKQNKDTSKIINLLRDRYSMDERIEKKLTKFSVNLLHLRVEFTACDIIPLDRTLLAIITGTTATYLIIVVQFYINDLN